MFPVPHRTNRLHEHSKMTYMMASKTVTDKLCNQLIILRDCTKLSNKRLKRTQLRLGIVTLARYL